jgi:hypothetical protein
MNYIYAINTCKLPNLTLRNIPCEYSSLFYAADNQGLTGRWQIMIISRSQKQINE